MSSDDLPKFKRPPVIETVLGVQFEPLAGFGNAHLGAFWKSLGGDWPNVADVPPLEPQFEEFGEAMSWRTAGLQLKLSRDPHTRLQTRNLTNDRMIQVQNGRLHYNWLGHVGSEYPSYHKVRPEFDWALDLFRQFLANQPPREPQSEPWELQPNQWEVTYVNHIPRGTVWEQPQDWTRLFPSVAVLPAERPPVRLESLGGQWHYEIEPQRGRLHVNVSHGWRKKPDECELLVLNLTARGPVGSRGEDGLGLDEGLQLGHEIIVKAFRDLTSKRAQEYWTGG